MATIRGNTGCVNHPAVEAVARCRQCGRPACGACVVIDLSGKFCCDECRDKYAKFMERAQEFELKRGVRVGIFTRLKRLLLRAVVLAAGLSLLGFLLTYLDILDIPFFRSLIDRFVNPQ